MLATPTTNEPEMNEVWKIVDVCDNYAVSNLGRVKRITRGNRTSPGNILSPVVVTQGRGYRRVILGKWHQGKMPRTAFPLSKSGGKAYRLGNRRWRVVEFLIGNRQYRLLINFSYVLAQYQAMLGVEEGADTKVIAQIEFHGTHPGWHAHVACDDDIAVPPGIRRGPWLRRMCGVYRPFDSGCPDTDNGAYALAYRIFRLGNGSVGPLV
jgi:hypothetical protein